MNTALNSFRQDGKPPKAPALPPLPRSVKLSREFRLAAACSWIAPKALQQHQNRMVTALCAAGVDWDAFLALVDRHGIPVQALCVLQRCLGEGMPEPLCQALETRSKKTKFRSFVQMGELIRINRLLREHDIAMMPLKGVLLSQKLYGSPDIRTSCDIDVLIRPENLAAVDRLLAEIGYRNCLTRAERLTARQQTALLAGAHHAEYVCNKSRQKIELHWRSRFWLRKDMAAFWQAPQFESLQNEQFDCPDDVTLFLFLCDHGSRHRWKNLKWLGDVAMMLAEGDLPAWCTVPVQAERLRMRRVVAQAALLVHWLYALPLPASIWQLVSEEKAALSLAKKAIEAMLGTEKMDGFPLKKLWYEWIDRAVYFLRLRPVVSSLRLLGELSHCHASDYLAFPLPDSLFWLYLPLRPFLWCLRFYNGRHFSGLRSKYGAE